MHIDFNEPATFIYSNPDFDHLQDRNIYETLETPEGKEKVNQEIRVRDSNIEEKRVDKDRLIDNLEAEILSFLQHLYINEEDSGLKLGEIITKTQNIETKRMCLIYLLGGGTLGYHFFNDNGSLKSTFEIQMEINNLISWKGISFEDYFMLNRVWTKMNKPTWILLKIMNKSKFVLDYLKKWFQNIYVKNLSLAAASLFFFIMGWIYIC